jgi:hypothetical protein
VGQRKRRVAVLGAIACIAAAFSLRCGGNSGAPSADADHAGSPSVDGSLFDQTSGPETSTSARDGGADGPADGAQDVFVPNDGPALVTGSVQKGPFTLGSSVTVSAIDGTGTPTGQVFNTQTSDDLGDFAVSFAYRGNVDMQAQGFYYDELTGALSSAPIVLRALYEVTNGGPQGAYINVARTWRTTARWLSWPTPG